MTKMMWCYEIKDPRDGTVFYVGIGDEFRVLELKRNDAVNARIAQIRAAGFEELRNKLWELPMDKCRIWEHREIANIRLVKDGGTLLNISKGTTKSGEQLTSTLNVSAETLSKAEAAFFFITESIAEVLAANPQGVRNTDVSNALGFQFPTKGGAYKHFLTHNILHRWVREGKATFDQKSHLFVRKINIEQGDKNEEPIKIY